MARKRDHSVRLKRGLFEAFRKGARSRYPQPACKLRYTRCRLNRGGNNNNNNNDANTHTNTHTNTNTNTN